MSPKSSRWPIQDIETANEKKHRLTPPVPESCIWLNPVILLSSLAYPPCNSPPLVSATALAIENGKLAPAKTCPPLMVPISGSTKSRILVVFCAWVGEIPEDSSIAIEAKETRRERAMIARDGTGELNALRCQWRRVSTVDDSRGKKTSRGQVPRRILPCLYLSMESYAPPRTYAPGVCARAHGSRFLTAAVTSMRDGR
jgi:hypothetical protein